MKGLEKNKFPALATTVTLFSSAILIGFAADLGWQAAQKYQDFKQSHIDIAEKATRIASLEVQRVIENKRRWAEIFNEDYHIALSELAKSPHDDQLYVWINQKLSRYFPDFFASSIEIDSGQTLIDDFEGFVGRICIEDMAYYTKHNKQLIRIHPNPNVYHFDILTRLTVDEKELLFWVSFDLTELSKLLRSVQPSLHKLMIIQRDMQDLIEIVDTGGRITIPNRLDFRLREEERRRRLSSTQIDGTTWPLIDLHVPGLLGDFKYSLVKEALITFLLFFVLVL